MKVAMEHGSGLVLTLRHDGAGWEIELVAPRKSWLRRWWELWVGAWREEQQARALARLDKRLLRDIGLDAGCGEPLAARADAYRQQEARRIAMTLLGLM